jgi:hypothetical protein
VPQAFTLFSTVDLGSDSVEESMCLCTASIIWFNTLPVCVAATSCSLMDAGSFLIASGRGAVSALVSKYASVRLVDRSGSLIKEPIVVSLLYW